MINIVDKTYKQKIIGFFIDHKRMPSYSELAKLVGFSSKNAAYKLAERLEEEGVVARDPKGRLIPRNFGGLRRLGYIEAGFPTEAEEEVGDALSLDDYLIKNREATFMLEVSGESMIDAGIQEGDYVLAERTSNPKVGDIVIAEVDGGWTMKYFRKKNGRVYLEAANEKFPDIYPDAEMKIAAKVVGVIRKYK